MSAGNLREEYAHHVKRKLAVVGALVVLILVMTLLSLRTGTYPLDLGDIRDALLGVAEGPRSQVFWNIRLPQVVAALLAGACLGLAGTAMQTVLRNPLASPFTLGVSQGALFGAVFAIVVLDVGTRAVTGTESASPSSPHTIAACAFAGSLVTVTVLLLLSSAGTLSPAALILAGVALSALFSSATMLLQYFATDIEIASAVFWTFGDLRKAQWPDLATMAIVMLPPTAFFLWKGWHFNAMTWGDDTARSLGVDVHTLRLAALALAALAASVTTVFMGIIGFVGLIAPHMVRIWIGQDHRFLFPCSALAGGVLLLVSDLLARTILRPVVLPVGILTSLAGALLFLFLLVKHRSLRS